MIETRGATGDGLGFYQIPRDKVDFDPNYGTLDVHMSIQEINGLARRDLPAEFIGDDQTSAARLIGMNVSVDGAFPFAEVEDLTFSGTMEVTSMVVEVDGPGGKIVAVPYDQKWISPTRVDLPIRLELFNDFDPFTYDGRA